jgi:hypothetical protein
MTDLVWIAVVTAGPPTIASFVSIVIAWLNNIQGNKIHVLVNSNLTAVKTDLALATDKIKTLQELVAKMTTKQDSNTETIQGMRDTAKDLAVDTASNLATSKRETLEATQNTNNPTLLVTIRKGEKPDVEVQGATPYDPET